MLQMPRRSLGMPWLCPRLVVPAAKSRRRFGVVRRRRLAQFVQALVHLSRVRPRRPAHALPVSDVSAAGDDDAIVSRPGARLGTPSLLLSAPEEHCASADGEDADERQDDPDEGLARQAGGRGIGRHDDGRRRRGRRGISRRVFRSGMGGGRGEKTKEKEKERENEDKTRLTGKDVVCVMGKGIRARCKCRAVILPQVPGRAWASTRAALHQRNPAQPRDPMATMGRKARTTNGARRLLRRTASTPPPTRTKHPRRPSHGFRECREPTSAPAHSPRRGRRSQDAVSCHACP